VIDGEKVRVVTPNGAGVPGAAHPEENQGNPGPEGGS
jgi:hypothetical protein